jgi:two-component system invasion response regulator UvrY
MIKLLIADDHAMIRNRIRQILSQDPEMEVCCEAADGLEVMDLLKQHPVDVVILDLNMPGLSGLETLSQISSRYPEMKVLMLTALSEGMYSAKAIKAGASGFISKESAQEELIPAIRKILGKE